MTPGNIARSLFVSVFFLTLSVHAQAPGSITGRVVLPDGRLISRSIRISLETMRGVKSNVFTNNQGEFSFRGLTPGSYQVVVEADKNLWETTSANVEVFPGAPAILTITLKEKKTSNTKAKGGDTVTATELATSIPPKAEKEFARAVDASRQGKTDESITHLRKAIEYFPAYLMAHNDLGAQLLEKGELDEAEVELRKAIAIDSKAFNPQLNLGIVLVAQKRFDEARDVLRKTLSTDPNSPAARFYLGQSLEGLSEFQLAAREFSITHDLGGSDFAVALFHLGNVYLKAGDPLKARKAFQKYIEEAPKGQYVAEANRLLNSIK